MKSNTLSPVARVVTAGSTDPRLADPSTNHSSPRPQKPPMVFPSLADETRYAVDTAHAAHYLNRKAQTLRCWCSTETFPTGLRPIRVMGRLAWPVAELRRVLGVTA